MYRAILTYLILLADLVLDTQPFYTGKAKLLFLKRKQQKTKEKRQNNIPSPCEIPRV